MPTIDVRHGRIDYRVAGPDTSTSPPVVFVHGLLVNAELWTPVAELLAAAGVRSYALDLPLGAHRTALNPDADLSPQGIAQLINEVLAALELTDVTLVGNDTGGALCQFLIDADHRRVGRLVLTDCDAFDKFPPAPFGLIVAIGKHEKLIRPLAAGMKARAMRHSVLAYGGLARDKLDPAMTRRWITPALTDAGVRRDLAKFLGQVRPADLLDVSTRLGQFPKPVRLVWGTKDPFFKLAFAKRLQRTFADATLVEVAGGRTFLSLDEPQRVADEIRALQPEAQTP